MIEKPSEAWSRAGFTVVNGELIRNDDANGNVQTAATGSNDPGNSCAALQEQGQVQTSEAASCSELPHTKQKEFQNGVERGSGSEAPISDDYREAGNSEMDRAGRGSFRISVTLYVSNHGRRDPIGALETICDLITATRRRLSERYANRDLASPVVRTRTRGGKRGDRKIVKDEVPF